MSIWLMLARTNHHHLSVFIEHHLKTHRVKLPCLQFFRCLASPVATTITIAVFLSGTFCEELRGYLARPSITAGFDLGVVSVSYTSGRKMNPAVGFSSGAA
jgi:hypothetical protein